MEDQEFINQLAGKLSKLCTVRPLGFHYLHPYGTVPADSIICYGATYSRALYKDFFDYITTQGWMKTEAEWQEIAQRDNGFCPFYSDGDGSTTFRTPKFAPYVQIAVSCWDLGKHHYPGLPDIRGIGQAGDSAPPIGAFSKEPGKCMTGTSYYDGKGIYEFNASRYNSIYGNSNTVQPESHEWLVCVVACGIATNVGPVDIKNVMSAVNDVQASLTQIKLDIAQIPQPRTYVTKTYVSGTQGYRVWSDGFIEQWGKVYVPGENTDKTLTFQKPFKNANYNIQTAGCRTSDRHACVMSKTATSVTIRAGNNDSDWYAFGY